MPTPIALLLLGAGGLLLLAKDKPKPKAPDAPPPGGGGGGGGGGGTNVLPLGCQLDDKLPPSYRDMLTGLVGKQVPTDQALAWASGLDEAADKLASAGYPKAAACAKLRADQLRKQAGGSAPPGNGGSPQPTPQSPPPLPNIPVPPQPSIPTAPLPQLAIATDMPFVVRVGDRPFGLAAYYTGDGGRMVELAQHNPQMGVLQTVNGISNYSAWKPGLGIMLPASWSPQSKSVPQPGL